MTNLYHQRHENRFETLHIYLEMLSLKGKVTKLIMLHVINLPFG